MPDQLTVAAPRGATTVRGRPPIRVLVLQALAAVALLVVAGAAAGAVWFQLWTPTPGVVQDGRWFTDEDGLRHAFAGTGLYVLVAVAAGLLSGALVAFLLDRAELVTLAATLVGAALGGWLMLRLGLHWSPADPEVLARTARDGTELDSALTVDVPHAWLAFPGAALLGTAVVFLATTKRGA
ncbi:MULTISPECIES: hypothetical protein [unclassified Nocardioides]|uniref:hypothetical protein n=1 Tax=unclassified Nocardioides TaxID=2615069 RepID=UPI002666E976|nr:hypothetical protein [Nocardioides sp. Arc9.136]WKN50100.1 hypothetical protein OSR43_08240 [Nocardioides sp. Arc9.136]